MSQAESGGFWAEFRAATRRLNELLIEVREVRKMLAEAIEKLKALAQQG